MKKYMVIFFAVVCVLIFGCEKKEEYIKKSASVLAHEMYSNTQVSLKVFKEFFKKDSSVSVSKTMEAATKAIEADQLGDDIEQYYCDKYNDKIIEISGCVMFKMFSNDGSLMMILGTEDSSIVRIYVKDEKEIKKCVKLKSGCIANGLATFMTMMGKQSVAEGDYVTMRGKGKVSKLVSGSDDKKRFFDLIEAKFIE